MDLLFFRWFSIIATLSLLLSACAPAPAASIAKSNQARLTNPNVPQDDVSALVQGNNAFALGMYQSLRGADGNLVYSPFSISLALAMTYAGARADTASQMAETLHYSLPQERLHPAFNQLDLALTGQNQTRVEDQQPMHLNIINAVWAEQTYPFLQEFLDLIALNYGVGIHLADFINSYEAVRKEINSWVSDQTKNKIRDLVPQGALTQNTRMVLVNAIYFKADWLDQFDKDSTSDAPFYLLDGSQVQVKTMSQDMFVPYTRGDDYQAIELPYAGETAAMDILLPDEGRFSQFEASLDYAKLGEMFNGFQNSSVMLSLPKFSFTTDFDLSAQLTGLGMTDAFDPERADFTGMTSQRELFISNVLHKAFVAVDEDGTEAAAATAVIVGVTSAPLSEITLKVDRPFIFFIRDLQSGQILFMGRVVNPLQ
jgi:serpin B